MEDSPGKYKRKACIFTGLVFLFSLASTPMRSAELPDPRDDEGMVRFLEDLTLNPNGGSSFHVTLIDSFEDKIQWSDRFSTAPSGDLRLIHDQPGARAFQMESQLLNKLGYPSEKQTALFVHTMLPVSGRSRYVLRIKEPAIIEGRALKLSAWIRTQRRIHQLVFLFQNQENREIQIAAGPLAWNGWKRIDLDLPSRLNGSFPRRPGQPPLRFTGLMIVSHPHEERQDVTLVLDQILVLTETVPYEHEGLEFSDSW